MESGQPLTDNGQGPRPITLLDLSDELLLPIVLSLDEDSQDAITRACSHTHAFRSDIIKEKYGFGIDPSWFSASAPRRGNMIRFLQRANLAAFESACTKGMEETLGALKCCHQKHTIEENLDCALGTRTYHSHYTRRCGGSFTISICVVPQPPRDSVLTVSMTHTAKRVEVCTRTIFSIFSNAKRILYCGRDVLTTSYWHSEDHSYFYRLLCRLVTAATVHSNIPHVTVVAQ